MKRIAYTQNHSIPKSPHACVELQRMPAVPDFYRLVHQISQVGSRLDKALLHQVTQFFHIARARLQLVIFNVGQFS